MAVKSQVGQVIVEIAPSDELVAISNEADITINPLSYHIMISYCNIALFCLKIDNFTPDHFFSIHFLSTNKSRVDAKLEFDFHRNIMLEWYHGLPKTSTKVISTH